MPTFTRASSKSIASPRGFTLLEILVVLTIVSILVGLASLSVGGNRYRKIRSEANRLLQTVVLASEEAVMQGEELGLRVEEDGYAFLYFDIDTEQWRELDERPFRSYKLPPGLTLELEVDGESMTLDRFRKADSTDSEPPQVFIFSDGELSQFEARVADLNDDETVTSVISDGDLPLELSAG